MATKKQKNFNGFKQILFTTDFSDASDNAFTRALSMAKKYGAKLVICHVVDTGNEAAGFYLPHISFDNLSKDMLIAAEEMLKQRFGKKLRGFKGFEYISAKGVPYKEILKLSKKKKADLIVMGTYGRSGLDRIVFGSTTERVLRGSKTPVLAVPAS